MAKTYFMQTEDRGPIKIGSSNNPASRLKSIQTGHFSKVMILATVEQDVEYELHWKFKDLRIIGEWFRPEKQLIDWILHNAQIADGMKRVLRSQVGLPVTKLLNEPIPLEEELCDIVLDWDEECCERLLDISEEKDSPIGDCTWSLEDQGADDINRDCAPTDEEEKDHDYIYEHCECEFHVWQRSMFKLDQLDIIERVGVNFDQSLLILKLKPLNSQRRIQQLDYIGSVAVDLDDVEWTVKTIEYSPSRDTEPQLKLGIDYHFQCLKRLNEYRRQMNVAMDSIRTPAALVESTE